MVADGITDRDGDMPVCPSGGLLGVGNPIAAAGLMKVAELFWQLRGEAGARQVPGDPKRGLAQAWGDLMQVGTVVILGR
jgi:acetyl-CoA C-acetyltransferase